MLQLDIVLSSSQFCLNLLLDLSILFQSSSTLWKFSLEIRISFIIQRHHLVGQLLFLCNLFP